MKIKAISFGFENCESADVPIEYVDYFHVDEITKTVMLDKRASSVREYESVKKLHVAFNKSINNFQGETQIAGSLFVERLTKYADICWFGFVYEDGSKKDYMVRWQEGSGDYENLGQRVENDEWYGLSLSINYPREENEDATKS